MTTAYDRPGKMELVVGVFLLATCLNPDIGLLLLRNVPAAITQVFAHDHGLTMSLVLIPIIRWAQRRRRSHLHLV